MKLNRQAIQRMISARELNIGGRSRGGNSGDGGGGVSPMWIDSKYISKEFFNTLFIAYDANDDEIEPNDTDNTVSKVYVGGDLSMPDGYPRVVDFGNSYSIKKVNGYFVVKVANQELFNFKTDKFYSTVQIHTTTGVLSDGYVTALSDIRKKDVVDNICLDVDAIALASLIRFTWKDGHDKGIHVGGIAQEWQKILPEAVIETEDGSLAMDYGVIGMVSAVSLASKVQEQEEEINELKKKNADLEERLEKIEKLLSEGIS